MLTGTGHQDNRCKPGLSWVNWDNKHHGCALLSCCWPSVVWDSCSVMIRTVREQNSKSGLPVCALFCNRTVPQLLMTVTAVTRLLKGEVTWKMDDNHLCQGSEEGRIKRRNQEKRYKQMWRDGEDSLGPGRVSLLFLHGWAFHLCLLLLPSVENGSWKLVHRTV